MIINQILMELEQNEEEGKEEEEEEEEDHIGTAVTSRII